VGLPEQGNGACPGDLLDAHRFEQVNQGLHLVSGPGGLDNVILGPTSTTLHLKISTIRNISSRFSGLARTQISAISR
jgi:hypothetical protein